MVQNMTAGKPVRLVMGLFWPVFAGSLLQQLYNLVDMLVVGQFISVNALSAVGSTGTLNSLIVGFVFGFTSGLGVLISRMFGANQLEKMRRYIANGIYLVGFIALLMTVCALVFLRPLLRLMQTPDAVMDDAYTYIFIIFAGIPATVLYNFVAGVLRALGDGKTPSLFLIVAAAINVALDLITVVVFGMGVEGVALATVFANLVSGLLCLWKMYKSFPVLRLQKKHFRFSRRMIRELFNMGTPMALMTSITMLSCTISQAATNGLGTQAMAAVTTGGKIQNILSVPMQSFGVALATYTGQNLGAQKLDRIKTGFRQILTITLLYTVVAGAAMAVFGRWLSMIYLKPTETVSLDLAARYCLVVGSTFPLLGALFVVRSTVQALGYTLAAMLGGGLELAARCFVVFVLVAPFGYTALCFAEPLAWLSANVLLVITLIRAIRQLHRRLAFLPAGPEAHRRRSKQITQT